MGFQDALTRNMYWVEDIGDWDGTSYQTRMYSVGKQPAWINYMTNYNKCFGNFAESRNQMFMTLNRRYETGKASDGTTQMWDATTYIDPKKFNYAFAKVDYSAQNFWVQI